MLEKLDTQQKKVEEVIKSQQHINIEFEEIKKKLEEKTKENAAIIKKNLDLERAVLNATQQLQDLDQYGRQQNLKICNIPVTKNESVENLAL